MRASAKRAKIFATGGSQAVRLPAEFRFEEDEVFIRRDRITGDVILSVRPRGDWRDFMRLRDQLGSAPPDFPGDRTRTDASDRDPFSDWSE